MARELQDVLHYFLPPPASASGDGRMAPAHHRVSVPLAPHDVVRLALLWNLAVEAARQGARVVLVVPGAGRCAPWLRPGIGPLGIEVAEVSADRLCELAEGVEDAAMRAASRAGTRSLVLVAVPVAWLRADADGGPLLDRVLLLTRPEERELLETWAALGAISERAPRARIGVSLFGVSSLADARRAFDGLAALAELELAQPLASYGVLIDDVHLSRSIVSQRPIALSQPSTPAARALTDVAAMLLEDADEPTEPAARV